MSDPYSVDPTQSPQQQQTVVNVAPPEPTPPPTPGIASDAQINAFLAGGVPSREYGGSTGKPAETPLDPRSYWANPEHSDIGRGIVKGLGRSALGLASWIPFTGDLFTEKGWLGRRMYAPGQGPGEDIGIAAGELAPFGMAGKALDAARLAPTTIDAIRNFSRPLGDAAFQIFARQSAVPGSFVNPGRLFATRANLPRVKAVKGAIAGTVGGMAQATPGDSSYTAKLENAAIGGTTAGLSAAIATPIARGAQQYLRTVSNLPTWQQNLAAAAIGAAAGMGAGQVGFTHPLAVAVIAGILHRGGFGVLQAHHLAPQLAALAAHLSPASPGTAGVVGAGAAALANEASPQGGVK
jgi:hypothetical protein